MTKKEYFSKKIKSKIKELVDVNVDPIKIRNIVNTQFDKNYTIKFIVHKIDEELDKEWYIDGKKYLKSEYLLNGNLQYGFKFDKSTLKPIPISTNDCILNNTPSSTLEQNNEKEKDTLETNDSDDYENPPSNLDRENCSDIEYIINCLETLNKDMKMMNRKITTLQSSIEKIKTNNSNPKFKEFVGKFFNLINEYL
ncbi:hypothetical protein [Tepidibacter sp. Z1-5]|uniref:hypothetical protein n=1 Tax=Tepidibacter sp. Z1-5 TaxID=3134138 RepID=UPI0030BF8FE6